MYATTARAGADRSAAGPRTGPRRTSGPRAATRRGVLLFDPAWTLARWLKGSIRFHGGEHANIIARRWTSQQPARRPLPRTGLRALVIQTASTHVGGAPSGVCRHRSGRLLPTRRFFGNINGSALCSVSAERARRACPAADLRPARQEAEPLNSAQPHESLARENAYLRQRVAQLQDDVTAITAEAERLRQIVERLHGRTAQRPPNPLGGGQ